MTDTTPWTRKQVLDNIRKHFDAVGLDPHVAEVIRIEEDVAIRLRRGTPYEIRRKVGAELWEAMFEIDKLRYG